MKLYLYRYRGDWCLEDPHYQTMLGDKVRYHLHDGTWRAELWYVNRWLTATQIGELAKIDPDRKLGESKRIKLIRDFLQRQHDRVA